jgi:hypothetical protein
MEPINQFSETIKTFYGTGIGATVLAVVLAWLAGSGVNYLLGSKVLRKILIVGLKSASIPAAAFSKATQAGIGRVLVGPFLSLVLFVIFWLFVFFDKAAEGQSPAVKALLEGLEKLLEESGSTDRRLYIQAKTMSADQVTAVSRMAAAVAAPADAMDDEQVEVLKRAEAIGTALQDSRLGAG